MSKPKIAWSAAFIGIALSINLMEVLPAYANTTMARNVCSVAIDSSYKDNLGNDSNSEDGRDWNYKRCRPPATPNPVAANTEEQSAATGAGSGANDWLTPGTKAYSVAKRAFDLMTNELGVGGVTAAAILGEIQPEANFVEDLAELGGLSGYHVKYDNQAGIPCSQPEGAGGGQLRFGLTGTAPVCGMAWYYKNGMLGGGGLFQFTPYTKFTESPYFGKHAPGWSIENQIDFVFDQSVWTRSLERNCFSYGGAAPNRTGTFTVESWLSETDPAKAGDIFYQCFLKGYRYMPERMDKARQANQVFNVANVQPDPSKWKIGSASVSGGSNPNSGVDSGSSGESFRRSSGFRNCEPECVPGVAKNVSVGGVAPTGVGGVSAWKDYNDLPPELKKDAIDFRQFGLSPGQCEAGDWQTVLGTSKHGLLNQCVAFSRMAAHVLWSKNGQQLPPPTGHGKQLAHNFASHFGGAVSNTPTRGAIGSQDYRGAPGRSPYGHTMIVLQTYSDGSALVAEQNNSMAGEAAGTVCDWRYIIYPKTRMDQIVFFDPSTVGYTLSLDGGSFGGGSVGRNVQSVDNECVMDANRDSVLAGGGDTSPLEYALTQQGKPYVLGTQGPDTFDCSGLTVWAAAQAGYDLLGTCGRGANAQYQCSKRLGLFKPGVGQCQRGDLVFISRSPGLDVASHIGFISDEAGERIMHAANPRVGLVEAAIWNKSLVLGCGAIPGSE